VRPTTKPSLAFLIQGAAAQFNITVAASSFVGGTTANSYPPSGSEYSYTQKNCAHPSSATANPSLFPSEPVVGFPGTTPTGLEPAAIYPYNNGPANQFPLVAPHPYGKSEFEDKFNIAKLLGQPLTMVLCLLGRLRLARYQSTSSRRLQYCPDASPLSSWSQISNNWCCTIYLCREAIQRDS